MNGLFDFLARTVEIFGFNFQYWMVVVAALVLLGVLYLYALGKSGEPCLLRVPLPGACSLTPPARCCLSARARSQAREVTPLMERPLGQQRSRPERCASTGPNARDIHAAACSSGWIGAQTLIIRSNSRKSAPWALRGCCPEGCETRAGYLLELACHFDHS